MLLDTLTAVATLAIVLAVTTANYARAVAETNVSLTAQQLDAINAATVRYGIDHAGRFPIGLAVTPTIPGSPYLPAIPQSPIGALPYKYGTQTDDGAPYVIIDTNRFSGGADTASDWTLLGNFRRHDGQPCREGDFLAVDPIHNVYCGAFDV